MKIANVNGRAALVVADTPYRTQTGRAGWSVQASRATAHWAPAYPSTSTGLCEATK